MVECWQRMAHSANPPGSLSSPGGCQGLKSAPLLWLKRWVVRFCIANMSLLLNIVMITSWWWCYIMIKIVRKVPYPTTILGYGMSFHTLGRSPARWTVQGPQAFANILIFIWLMVYLPLWKRWVRQSGWWHSQYMEKQNMFQTTNQLFLTSYTQCL